MNQPGDHQSNDTLAVASAFMAAFGSNDVDAMNELMADDMIWHNEGDESLPWIGHWVGRAQVLEFIGRIGQNFKATAWNAEDGFASGDTAVFFGTMNGELTKTGKETGLFTYGLRVKVRDGKVVLWNWLEDSHAVSNAYHG